ncbi:probable zinc transporter protein DDB_G0291141 [Zingiber officinale]|uniref:Cation efflux protein transmembrane domain-containing protein n=1 Tax=Zingiber officinale TaxID=94328 RepID=A0A8J5H1U3_ZINOF|nr:probable zinc transporter protein DDB_G0291141 [Zingiber officinale]KAG6515061.1 hypothetical protein ZIOFF_025440 [Zingiber officinale]
MATSHHPHSHHHHHRASAPSPIPIPSRLYSPSFPSPFPATPSAASTPSKRRRPLHHHSSSSAAAASLLIPLFSLRSLYSLLPFVRSYSASISLFPFAFLVSLLSFALSLLIPSPEPLKSLPPRSLLRPLSAKSALLTLTLLLRFHSLRYCSAGAAILADVAGSLLAKTLSDTRLPNPRRRIIGVAALATAVSLLSYSWDRIGCFPISSSPQPSEGCARIAPMALPFLSGFLGFYERAFANWGSLRQLGRRRVRLLSLGLATAFLFVPACASFVLADSSDGDALSVGSLGWPLINTVVFGVVLSENYGDDKLLFSAKDFRRDFLVNFFCTLVLELFYFPKLSLPGFLFCGLLLWIGVRELGSSSLSYVELGSSDPQQSLSSMIMNPIRHILSERKSRKIALFLLINTAYMVVEFVVGFMSNSLGLISDACHMLFDCAALAIGLYASYISRLPANSDFNYGRGRFEVLSGYVNAVFLVLVGALIVLESLERILEPQEISTNSLLAVSIGGLLVNVIGLIFFHEEHHHAHGGAATCSHSHLHLHDHHPHHDHHEHHDCKHANEGGGHSAENQQSLVDSLVSNTVHSHVNHEHHGHHHQNNQSENNSSNCHGHGHEDHNHSHEHGHHDKLCSDQLHTDQASRKLKNSHEGSHSLTTQPLQSRESSVREKILGDSHKHHHIDHNMEGIFLHVLADTMGSVGVVISTLLIKYKGWTVADPACSIFISVMIVSSVLPLLRNSAEILLQRVPRGREQDLRLAVNEISRIKGVQSIQNMHVWNFTNTEIVGSVHLHVSAETDTASAADTASKLLRDVGIKDLTIQVECVKG